MNLKNKTSKLLNIQYPLIQAPMAGGYTTPELVAAVSNSGALGSFAAGYLQPNEIRSGIRKIRILTDKPFSVNVFIPEKSHATATEISKACLDIQKACEELAIQINPISPPYASSFEEQMEVIFEENISIVSFTFGVLYSGSKFSDHFLR